MRIKTTLATVNVSFDPRRTFPHPDGAGKAQSHATAIDSALDSQALFAVIIDEQLWSTVAIFGIKIVGPEIGGASTWLSVSITL